MCQVPIYSSRETQEAGNIIYFPCWKKDEKAEVQGGMWYVQGYIVNKGQSWFETHVPLIQRPIFLTSTN